MQRSGIFNLKMLKAMMSFVASFSLACGVFAAGECEEPLEKLAHWGAEREGDFHSDKLIHAQIARYGVATELENLAAIQVARANPEWRDKLREQIIKRNWAFLVGQANKFCSNDPRMKLEDKVLIGAVGLLDAFDDYRPEFKMSFYGYAKKRVRWKLIGAYYSGELSSLMTPGRGQSLTPFIQSIDEVGWSRADEADATASRSGDRSVVHLIAQTPSPDHSAKFSELQEIIRDVRTGLQDMDKQILDENILGEYTQDEMVERLKKFPNAPGSGSGVGKRARIVRERLQRVIVKKYSGALPEGIDGNGSVGRSGNALRTAYGSGGN